MYNCQELFIPMYNINEILSKIRQIENISTDTELSDILKVTPQHIYIWKKRNTIPYKELIEYCSINNISLDWLLTGKTPDQSLKSVANTVSEPPATYSDPRDKIIQTLTEENRRLKETLDTIHSAINKSHNLK